MEISEPMYDELIKQARKLCKENVVWDKSKDYTNKLATVSSSKSGTGKLSNLIKINHKENGLVSIQDKWLNKQYIKKKYNARRKLESIRELQ